MKQKCKKCNYEWESKKEEPKQCPRCKRYDWNTPQNKRQGLDKKASRRPVNSESAMCGGLCLKGTDLNTQEMGEEK